MNSTLMVASLNQLLANAMVFQQTLKHYHWEVAGEHFFTLHAKFEELYGRWGTLSDDLAERILALKGRPLSTLSQAVKLSKVDEEVETPDSFEMVKRTLLGLEIQLSQFRNVIAQAEETGDRTTANLLDDISDEIEKTSWMLRAFTTGK